MNANSAMECIGILPPVKTLCKYERQKFHADHFPKLDHMVRMISLDDMHSENIWFKWSENRKWKAGDLVGLGDTGGPGGPCIPGGPCDLGGQNSQGY